MLKKVEGNTKIKNLVKDSIERNSEEEPKEKEITFLWRKFKYNKGESYEN